jgi:hypothetical protein
MSKFAVIALLPVLALGGCVSMSRSSPVTSLSADWARDGRIDQITVTRGAALKVTPEFDSIFKAHVKAKLDTCAKGSRPLRLEAKIDRLDKANPVITTVVAGANILRGEARLVDVATGRVVADYKVGKTIVGGRFAIIVMGQAEEQLSDAFGDEMCKQAFQAVAAASN